MTADEEFTFFFDLKLYRLTAVKKAAYRFIAHFEVRLESVDAESVRATLRPMTRQPAWQLDPQQFPAEVLDQELRETVAEETKAVRDILLAQAFSGLSVIDPIGENADFREDPLSIARNRSSAD